MKLEASIIQLESGATRLRVGPVFDGGSGCFIADGNVYRPMVRNSTHLRVRAPLGGTWEFSRSSLTSEAVRALKMLPDDPEEATAQAREIMPELDAAPKATASKFKLGETVKLRSGGPIMSVIELEENGDLRCFFFDNNSVGHTCVLPQEALRSV